MSKIVVFGGDGFIGKHLVRRLAIGSSDIIHVFDRFSSYQTGSKKPFNDLDNVYATSGNFFNREEVNNVLEGAEYVFHLISSTNPATSINDPFIDIDTNIRSSIELFQLCVDQGVRKIIFISSGGTVYGNVDNERIPETSIPRPLSPYAIGKITIEHYLRYFKHTHGLESITYRVANPYGPGQNIYGKQGVVPIFMHKYVAHEPITIFGDGEMMRDYIYIDDLISMIVGSYNKSNSEELYNIGNGKGVSVNEIVAAIEQHAGYSVKKSSMATPPTYIQKSVLDIDRFVTEFGIEPSIDLNEGIKRTWDYVKKLK